MKTKTFFAILLVAFLLTACGIGSASEITAETAQPTFTPDPCLSQNLPGEVAKINSVMREFDDYSELASNTPQTQLVEVIPDLQRVLREAEDQQVPPCLTQLKEYQLAHMNVVVRTLMAFVANADAQLINAGISQSQDLHNQYDIEMARLLGVTLVVPPTSNPLPITPASGGTPSLIFVTNIGTEGATLLSAPQANAGGVAVLEAGLTTVALGKTEDGKWIQVEVPGQPGQKAWVDASLVAVSGELPVVSP